MRWTGWCRAAGAGLVAMLAGGAPAVLAHPHVFIDAGVELRFDAEGRIDALRIVWVYDDFVSMLILAERGLDPDPTGALDAAGRAALDGFDMQWIEGFEGDSYLLVDGRPVALGGPEGWSADTVGGRIVTSHLRPLPTPVDPGSAEVVVQIYDPEYYTAYTIAATPRIAGRADCTAAVYGPDLAAASEILAAALAELTASADLEAEFPAVGAAYAEEVRVRCAGQ